MMPKALRDYWAKKRARSKARPKASKKVSHMSRRKSKIALAPIIGFVAGLYPGLKYIWDCRSDSQIAGDETERMVRGAAYAYLGITQQADGTYTFGKLEGLMKGTIPLVGGALGGYLVHKAANKFGVNKHIPWVSL